jgi:integrase
VCAINTGMRKGEILSLRWNQIRNGFIYLDKTKTKTKREIPINDTLDTLLAEIMREQGRGSEYVFSYKKRASVSFIDTAWKSARTRAGIENFHFHDLRHTFASYLVMRGATLKDVQELLGHKGANMTLRYAHLSQEHKKAAVNLLNNLPGNPPPASMSQNVTNPIRPPVSPLH